MYFAIVILTLFVLPPASVAAEALLASPAADLLWLMGKWLTFWAVGARLLIAGFMQVFRPQFTARIFAIDDPAALAVVREIGFANLTFGTLGLLSLAVPQWLIPTALAGAIFYGLAGAGHAARGGGTKNERFAMITDFVACAFLAIFLITRAL
jgi:hypothetical protein